MRNRHPSVAARAAFPVMVNDSLPAILRCCRCDRRRPMAKWAEAITGIVVVAWHRRQSGVRGVSSLGVMRRCDGNDVTHGDLPSGWAGAQPVSRPSAAKQSRQGVPMVVSIWALFLHKASYFSNHLRANRAPEERRGIVTISRRTDDLSGSSRWSFNSASRHRMAQIWTAGETAEWMPWRRFRRI